MVGLRTVLVPVSVIYYHGCSCAQTCLNLCDLMNCSPPGSSAPEKISQARILEGVAISFSGGIFEDQGLNQHL